MINANSHNKKDLWKALNSILHRNKLSILPDTSSLKDLANRFGQYFVDKIAKISATFPTSSNKTVDESLPPPGASLLNFCSVSESDVHKVITNGPSKSCSLDPWPSFLVEEFLDILITPITDIVNKSLGEGVFPSKFKQVIVTPLIKKAQPSQR